MTKMAQNDPKMAQNSLKMAQNGPKRPKNGPKWVFMTFIGKRKKGQNLTKKVEKSRNLTKNGPFWTPKCPFSRKWPVFGPGGKNTRKHAFFAPNLYQKPFLVVFGHFWDFSIFSLFWPMYPKRTQLALLWHYCGITGFALYTKKNSPFLIWPKIALFGPLNAHFLENSQFSAPGAKIPENTLFLPQIYARNHFWWFLGIFEIFRFFSYKKWTFAHWDLLGAMCMGPKNRKISKMPKTHQKWFPA